MTAPPGRKETVEYYNRFQKVLERIQKHRDYGPPAAENPYGTFRKRPIIGEYTPINGGVYLGVIPHEALVVDDKYGALKAIFTELMVRYVKRHGGSAEKVVERTLIEEILELVKEKLKYTPEERVQRLVHQEDLKPDKKVALDIYLERGIGTDRHQVLLAAYLVERAIKKNLLKGKIYIDGHYPKSAKRKEKLIYSSASGYLFVFSPSDD